MIVALVVSAVNPCGVSMWLMADPPAQGSDDPPATHVCNDARPPGRACWAGLRQNYLDLGAQPALPGQEPSTQEGPGDGDTGQTVPRRLSHQAAARAELDAVAAVGVARMPLTDAALAVLQARLARIQAGEDQPDSEMDSETVDGHVPLHGRNAVSRHGPALAHGLTGEIKYVLARKPRNT